MVRIIATWRACANFTTNSVVLNFVTSLTAGSALVGGAVFVATSNLRNSAQSRFDPGTVLVFDVDFSSAPPLIRPDPMTPVVLTTGFRRPVHHNHNTGTSAGTDSATGPWAC